MLKPQHHSNVCEHLRQEKTLWASITHCINPIYSLSALKTLFGQHCDEWWDAAVVSTIIGHLYHTTPQSVRKRYKQNIYFTIYTPVVK